MSYKFKVGLASILSLLFISACASKPTKTNENPGRLLKVDEEEATNAPLPAINIREKTQIIDARPAFEYSTAHIPRAIPIQWDEFSQSAPEQKGLLQSDLFSIARRLAREGIAPDTPVVVVGNGLRGQGEEGRLAWMLAYLGVSNVQFVDMNAVKGPLTTLTNRPTKNAPIWKPQTVDSLLCTRDEILHAVNKGGLFKPIQSHSSDFDKAMQKYRLIDVRSSAEYLGKEGFGLTQQVPDIGAINIVWKEFLTPQGRPQLSLAAKLESVGILRSERILVLDNNGVRSGTAVMALRAMGYKNAANCAGGIVDLMSAYNGK